MDYPWDRLVGSIVWPRARASALFGLPPEELMQVGRLAAWEAVGSWDRSGARTLPSWIYLHVVFAVNRALAEAGRHAAEDGDADPFDDDEEEDLDARYLICEALEYMEARLPREDWVLLWLHHAEGWTCCELAERWGIKPNAMRQRIFKAKRRAVTLSGKLDIVGTGAADVR